MIGRVWQRLLKESLITIYRDSRTAFAKNFPVYYFAFDSDLDRVGLAVQSLQQIPQIPWPSDKCIILAEDVALSLLTDDPDVRGLVWIVYSKNYKVLLGSPDESEIFISGATYSFHNRIVSNKGNLFWMTHVDDPQTTFEKFMDPEDSRKRAMSIILTACKAHGITANPDSYSRYLDKVLVSDHSKPRWVAFDSSKIAQPGLAADVLSYLANLAVPCHYMFKSRSLTGFGPTGEIKRLTKSQPIFTVIPHNRVYRIYGKTGEGQSPAPHPRDGHIRHYWLQGIPPLQRALLPSDPIERLKLVHSHKVPRVYIHPTWVGPNELESDDFALEVMTGEMPLKGL